MRREVAIAAIALLSVVALVGWTRKASPAPAANFTQPVYTQPVSANTAVPCVYGQPAPYGQPATAYGQPVAQPVAYGQAAYGQPCAVVPNATPVMYVPAQPVVAQPQAQYASYQPAPAAPAAPVRRAVVQRSSEPVQTVRRTRPFSHSVAIVAGSSGAGAAIGALAGGGKGAAIGALAGGAGGFIYDRITRNR